jgi:hypothetical protein
LNSAKDESVYVLKKLSHHSHCGGGGGGAGTARGIYGGGDGGWVPDLPLSAGTANVQE